MLKFGLRFLHDRKKEGKNSNQGTKPELPAFEWQVTSDTSFEDCLPSPTSTSNINPPNNVILYNTDGNHPLVKTHSRSTTNVESGRIRLIQIIEEEEARTKFRNYLVSQYCEENLDFYMDIIKFHTHFKSEGSLNLLEIISCANYIWNEYLDSETSSKALNVPQDLLNNCKQKISKKLFTIDLFDKLQQHCFDLMLQDSLPKFTRNSMAFSSSEPLFPPSTPSSPTFLRPPSFVGINHKQPPLSLRKSISSGSLRTKMMASLKTVTEPPHPFDICHATVTPTSLTSPTSPTSPTSTSTSPTSPTSTSTTSTSTSPTSPTFTSTSHTSFTSSASTSPTSPISPTSPLSSKSVSSNSDIISTSADSSNRSSTVSTLSTPTTIVNVQQRVSMASVVSITNITKRMLSRRRRNSTSSNSSKFSVTTLSSVFYLSSMEKFMGMPGTYPCTSVPNNNTATPNESDEGVYDLPSSSNESDEISTWQKLRKNISTPNLSRSILRSNAFKF
ncbi:16755_t:CDS:2 [Funneliformis geosporum]|nr:16755_t:CDS:2 [Funneliformis geosporum]